MSSQGDSDIYEQLHIEWAIGNVFMNTFNYDDAIPEKEHAVDSKAFMATFSNITVGPNPVRIILNINGDSHVKHNYTLSLSTSEGKILSNNIPFNNKSSAKLTMKSLPAGLYLLRITSTLNGLVKTFRIIKK